MKNTLEIEIKGGRKSGKSILSYIILQALKEKGINVKMVRELDYKDQETLNQGCLKLYNKYLKEMMEFQYF